MIAAATKSMVMQNGGHHRVLATKWLRCCHRSFNPWPTKPMTISHADPVTPAAALAVGALVGAALVQLSAEGWATRWQPVATMGGSSLVGRLRMGGHPS